VIEVRDSLVAAIDNELENPLTSDEMFNILLQARSTVYLMLTETAEGKSQLMEVTLPEVQPAVVVAYDYYDDADRNLEITTRNKVANSGFCPVNMRLLTK
jgi:prophage DNA circulation protein